MEDNEKHIRKILEGERSSDTSNDDLKAFQKIADQTERLKVPKGKDKKAAWNDLLNKIAESEKKPTNRPILWAAASIALLVCGYIFLYQPNAKRSVGNGEMLTVNLPKGSIVTLNAGSSINYDEKKWEYERIINLYGEARFEVTKGSKFTVVSAQGRVSVLGTSFDVYDRNGHYHVRCKTGKVEVGYKGEKQLLVKGQRTQLKNGELTFPSEVKSERIDDWTKGEFYFEEVLLGNVFDEMERQFDIEIFRTEEMDLRVYNGDFTNKNLDTALQKVLLPMNMSYQLKGKEVHITSNE